MPKETFFRLPEEKKKKIEQALKKEFSRVSFAEASISRVIEEANIPRGSFYQYFEDKEDAIKYMMEEFKQTEKQKIRHLLDENQGDLFATAIAIFDHVIEGIHQKEEIKLCQNVMQELKNENKLLFEEIHQMPHTHHLNIKQIPINRTKLNIQEEEDLEEMMKLVTNMVRTAIMEVITNRVDREQGKKSLIRQIKILKRGMEKQN